MNENAGENSFHNSISEFVLDSVNNWEELNADTQYESDLKFKSRLIKSLDGKEIGTYIGRGEQFLVQTVKDVDGLVIKRLRAGEKLDHRGNLSNEEYFQDLQRQHLVILKYFGNKFVPKTEFIEVNHNFNDPFPEKGKVIPGHEYIMIQEKIEGEDAQDYLWTSSLTSEMTIPLDLQKNFLEFIECYKRMQHEENAAIEDQFSINFATGEIKISDTNRYFSFENAITDNFFLEELNITPQMVNTAEQIFRILAINIPEFKTIEGLPYEKIVEMQTLLGTAPESVTHKYPERSEKQEAYIRGFRKLVTAAEYFPPGDLDNKFIKKIVLRFGLHNKNLQ